MKKVYKAHPLMVLSKVAPFLLIFIFPVVKAFLQYFTKGKITDILGFEITIFLIITAMAVIHCLSFKLTVDEDELIVETGFVFRKKAQIKRARLSSIQVQQNPLDMLCSAVTYRINTEAGSRRLSDFKFKLSLSNSKSIYNQIYLDTPVSRAHFSPIKVAAMAATTSSAFMGMVIGVPIIYRTGSLLGVALNEMLLDEINNVSNKFQNYFPPIVNTISLIFLLAYGVSFVYTFVKYVNFKLYLGEKSLEVKTGVFVRSATVFKKKSVNNVKIEQTPLMLLFKRFAMKVSVGGFGETKAVSQIVVPSGKWEEIEREFYKYFPFLAPQTKNLRPAKSSENRARFLFWPTIYLGIIFMLSVILAVKFVDFGKLILFLTVIATCVVFYHAYTCIYELEHGKIGFSDNVYARGRKGFNTCSLYCPKENIGEIKVTRLWTDAKKNTCRVRITVSSERADSMCVRLLNYDETMSEISKNFNIPE